MASCGSEALEVLLESHAGSYRMIYAVAYFMGLLLDKFVGAKTSAGWPKLDNITVSGINIKELTGTVQALERGMGIGSLDISRKEYGRTNIVRSDASQGPAI